MPQLSEGANSTLSRSVVEVSVNGPVDVTALVLSADGKVSGDADMVFFNQPSAPGVRWHGDRLTVDLEMLRPGAEKVVVVAGPEAAGRTFEGLTPTLTVEHGTERVEFTPTRLGVETVAVLAEFYRRAGQWKVRAVGQGYASGLAGLATDFGVDVDPEPTLEAVPPSPGPVAGGVSFTKGEDRLPLDMRKALNLRKEKVAVVLREHALGGLQCRVIVVLDTSGSTAGLYRRGVFSRAVERVAPVAAQVDDGAEMQAWAMGAHAARLDDITIGDLPQWLDRYTRRRFPDAGGVNNEKAVLSAVLDHVTSEPLDIPTLVLFFHDGGVTDNRGTEAAIRAADSAPVFWQFIGVGRSNYGVLQRLDTLAGRRHDNTGFFALDDIDAVSDEELYRRIFEEFPSWMRGFYPPGSPALAGLG